jgi:dolichol kinase
MHCYKWALSYNGKILNGILMIFIKFHQLPFQCYLFIIWWFYLNDINGSRLLKMDSAKLIALNKCTLDHCSPSVIILISLVLIQRH